MQKIATSDIKVGMLITPGPMGMDRAWVGDVFRVTFLDEPHMVTEVVWQRHSFGLEPRPVPFFLGDKRDWYIAPPEYVEACKGTKQS